MQHGFGESEISWITTGKANIILDNLIEMGKIKPFTLVMSDGMVQEKVGSEERLNHVLLERIVLVKLFCNTLFDKYLTVTSLHRC